VILLTPEEIVAAELNGARRFAHDICVYAHKIGLRQKRGPTPNRELYIREALCRAQVKKLIEWLEGDCTEHEPSIFAFTLPVERKDCPECWQALKAAAAGARS
jgi:hypothetical protein